jgi:hypothetical protein
MVRKWMQGLKPKGEGSAKPAAAGATDSSELSTCLAKYEWKGELAVNGCKKCAYYYPGHADECMTCGGQCARQHCTGKDKESLVACFHSELFQECHRQCVGPLTDGAIAPEHQPRSKWIRLKRVFMSMRQSAWYVFDTLLSDSLHVLF